MIRSDKYKIDPARDAPKAVTETMRIFPLVTTSWRTASSWLEGTLGIERQRREWWSYLGTFGDDFFTDD